MARIICTLLCHNDCTYVTESAQQYDAAKHAGYSSNLTITLNPPGRNRVTVDLPHLALASHTIPFMPVMYNVLQLPYIGVVCEVVKFVALIHTGA